MSDEAKVYEAEAAATRTRIAQTIDDLQARLSPKALLDSAVVSVNEAGTRAFASIREAAAGHPVVLGATGLAVGVAALAGSRVARAKVEYGDSYAAYADYDESYATNLADSLPAPGKTRSHIDAIQHQAHATVDDSPLMVVGVGLATGALLGAILPRSPIEAALSAEVRARLAAAGDAALTAAKAEIAPAKLSLAGGTAGISERLVQSLIVVLGSAVAALARPVTSGSRA